MIMILLQQNVYAKLKNVLNLLQNGLSKGYRKVIDLVKGDFVKERAARRGGSGSLVHIKEVDVLLAGWKDNVQPLAGSTPAPRKFRR